MGGLGMELVLWPPMWNLSRSWFLSCRGGCLTDQTKTNRSVLALRRRRSPMASNIMISFSQGTGGVGQSCQLTQHGIERPSMVGTTANSGMKPARALTFIHTLSSQQLSEGEIDFPSFF